ncbi:uncharacterized protein LOC120344056 [Styela clava]
MLICSLFVLVYITVSIDAHSQSTSFIQDKCGLTPKKNVDWSQISSSDWYLSFKSSDEIFSKVVNCQVVKNITNDLEGGVKFHFKNYYYSGSKPKEFVVALFKTKETATYRGIQDADHREADSRVSPHVHDTAAAQEVECIENGDTEIMFATDYSTYIVCIDCNIFEGIKWIGVYTPTPYPSAKELIDIRNALIDLNAISPLNNSQCSDVMGAFDISTK